MHHKNSIWEQYYLKIADNRIPLGDGENKMQIRNSQKPEFAFHCSDSRS